MPTAESVAPVVNEEFMHYHCTQQGLQGFFYQWKRDMRLFGIELHCYGAQMAKAWSPLVTNQDFVTVGPAGPSQAANCLMGS